MGSRLPEYRVVSDREGFFVEDEYGEDMTPTQRFGSHKDAAEFMRELMAEDLANYDGPPDGEAWSGGFAANH